MQKVQETLSQKYPTRKGLVEWVHVGECLCSRCEILSSNTNTKKFFLKIKQKIGKSESEYKR
jgi:hypothetical protein